MRCEPFRRPRAVEQRNDVVGPATVGRATQSSPADSSPLPDVGCTNCTVHTKRTNRTIRTRRMEAWRLWPCLMCRFGGGGNPAPRSDRPPANPYQKVTVWGAKTLPAPQPPFHRCLLTSQMPLVVTGHPPFRFAGHLFWGNSSRICDQTPFRAKFFKKEVDRLESIG